MRQLGAGKRPAFTAVRAVDVVWVFRVVANECHPFTLFEAVAGAVDGFGIGCVSRCEFLHLVFRLPEEFAFLIDGDSGGLGHGFRAGGPFRLVLGVM